MTGIPFAEAVPALIEIGRRLDARGWAPATSGNYSARLDDGSFAVTVSGTHKGRLDADGIMRVDAAGQGLTPGRPSAETTLHLALYRLFPGAGAVLHSHSPQAVGLSRAAKADQWVFSGHEMLKAFPGVSSHEAEIRLPIVDNSQDMTEVEAAVGPVLGTPGIAPAYLIRGHGLYAWGATLDEAERVLEATEWLIAAERAEQDFRRMLAR
ncbi:methylthioribulose 1-phosphate dehydratase [Sphingomonas psychrotolerans]|uniref:Methylthioribulose-1-phosphate dehydratase n=1 Tax=Sphingomonas psychrotolerans TaxID=1327635 RepID=A0ABU3MYZ5_9SPHN|nr:methylthioribulose 1-phosphate dehydratase [Sphingomonas psychrotolerans]MDT8757443.1 methylthioribulose 1-phosphate dehydratase [Sphingomonas psychrotolerans]